MRKFLLSFLIPIATICVAQSPYNLTTGKYVIYGLSSDTKPTTPPDNCYFIEINTGNTYISSSNSWNSVGIGVTQSALNLKANLASPTFTGTVAGITASMVGLGNVTNESKATMFTSPTFTGTLGGNLVLGTNSLTMTGSLAATGARVTKGWFTDVESTNMFTVGGTSLSSTFQGLNAKLTSIGALASVSGYLFNDGAGNFSYGNPAGSGTVTSVSVVTANGVSGSVATSTSTPAITLTLGAITPTTVAPTSTVTLAAGSTSIVGLNMNSASVLKTSPAAGDIEYNGANLYFNPETTMGRGYVPDVQRFRLTADGSTISTIANFFGSTSNPTLVSGAEYIIEIDAYFTNTTSGTVTWTFTNSAAPTSQNIHARFSPVAGIVAPEGSAAATYLEGDIQADATAAKALTTSGTLTTSTTQWAHFSIHLYNSTGTSLKIQATKLVGGTITPLKGSYWTCTRVPSSNTGTFSN